MWCLKGKEHKPFAQEKCHVMLVGPRGVVNTGDTSFELTAENDVWISCKRKRRRKGSFLFQKKGRD